MSYIKKLLRTPELFGQGSGRLFECDGAPGEPPADNPQTAEPSAPIPATPVIPTSLDVPKPPTLEDLEIAKGDRAAGAATTLFNGSALS